MRRGEQDRGQATPQAKENRSKWKKETAGKLQIDPDKDQVTFMGEDLVHETFVYYLLNKPAGVISATEDDHHQTVLDLLDETARHKEVFPVGRLDIDTHGLLLLTNNGKARSCHAFAEEACVEDLPCPGGWDHG